MAEDQLRRAKALIDQRRFAEARQLLENTPGDKADLWRRKLDERIGVQPVRPVAETPWSREIPMPPPSPYAVDERSYREQPLSMSDIARAQAQTKSYTGALVLVIVLYFVFVIPGIIANVLFYNDGKRMEEIAGTTLPGVAALGTLRTLMFAILILILILLVMGLLLPLISMQPH